MATVPTCRAIHLASGELCTINVDDFDPEQWAMPDQVPVPSDPQPDLTHMNAATAVAFVAEQTEVGYLQALLTYEADNKNRATVIRAIESKLSELAPEQE